MPVDPERQAAIASALAATRGRLVDACAEAGRDIGELTMIAVAKGFPASDVAILASLGISDIGENRDQEARAKIAELGELARAPGQPALPQLRWHFVGRLQRNKCRFVARYAHAVHSLDRAELADALAAGADRAGRRLRVFVQVSLDGDATRGGALIEDVPGLADAVAGHSSLDLAGVMAVAPLGTDADGAFARLSEVAQTVRARHPQASAISAGMSADLEPAVRHGATHVRVGSALLGRRTALFG